MTDLSSLIPEPAPSTAPVQPKVVIARYRGRCGTCGQHYTPGETIVWRPGVSWHKLCYERMMAAGLVPQPTLDTVAEPVAAAIHTYQQLSLEIENALPNSIPTPTPVVRDGFYTIVSLTADPDTTEYITLRVETVAQGKLQGRRIISFLFGPDNLRDYTGFAFLSPAGPKLWRRYADNARLLRAAQTLLQDPAASGEAYALRSGRCCRCNHMLTVPASIHRGMGPVCAKGGRNIDPEPANE